MDLAPFPTTCLSGIVSSEPTLNEFEALCFTVLVECCGIYEVCIPGFNRNMHYPVEKGHYVELVCSVRPDQTLLLINDIEASPSPQNPDVPPRYERW